MQRVRNLIEKIVPQYAWPMLIAVVSTNFLVYVGCRMLVADRPHFSLYCAADDWIPFCSFFVIFYVLAYLQWIIGFILIGRMEKRTCYYLFTAEIIAKLICAVFFVIYPTTIIRPEITGTGFFDWLTGIIYQADAADNLFPSIHCLESWVCYRSIRWMKHVPAWYKPITLLFSLGVFASTVFLKQHVVVDIIGGILVYEIGLLISKRLYRKVSG